MTLEQDQSKVHASLAVDANSLSAGVIGERNAPVAVSAKGATIHLSDGSNLVDFASGGLGYRCAPVADAVRAQFNKGPLSTKYFLSAPLAHLVSQLAEIAPGDLEVSYLCNSSSEAMEGALKLARGARGADRTFLALNGSVHGHMLGAIAVSGASQLRGLASDLPLRARFVRTLEDLVRHVDKNTAAVVIDMGPGAGFSGAMAELWLPRLRARCDEFGAILVANESSSGFGLTGRLFAVDHYDIVPDVLVFGETLGGGLLPVAGYITTRALNSKVYGSREPAMHASATGGSPVACRSAIAT